MKRLSRRFANAEIVKNTKSAAFFIGITLILIVLLYFVGIPLLGKFTAFITSFRGNNQKISSNDITPPPTPKFKYFPEYTNQTSVTLEGNTEAGATVKLVFDGSPQETLADNNGQFSFNVTLQNGSNTFSAIATDQTGNQSQKSEDYTITFDNKAPDLEITSPSDGSNFFGSTQRQLTIEGTTETDAQVTINERILSVDDNGAFQYTTTLNDGENKFTVKAVDKAGNSTEKSLTVNFTP